MSKTVHSVLFKSRNKDNKGLKGFKERKKIFFTEGEPEFLVDKFNDFVAEGVPGELSRFYYSVNPRDVEKTNIALIKFLLDHPDYPLEKIQGKVNSLSNRKENASTKRWLIDFDSLDVPEEQIVNEVTEAGNFDPSEIEVIRTIGGYHLITPRGFDSRSLIKKYNKEKEEIFTVKRDELFLYRWAENQK